MCDNDVSLSIPDFRVEAVILYNLRAKYPSVVLQVKIILSLGSLYNDAQESPRMIKRNACK